MHCLIHEDTQKKKYVIQQRSGKKKNKLFTNTKSTRREGRNNAYKRTGRKRRNNLHKRGKRSNKLREEKEELIKIIKEKEAIVEIDYYSSFLISHFSDVVSTYEGNISPKSIAVEKGHFDIVKHILVNSSYIDLSDTGKSPLFLAAEKGYRDILVLSLYSKYNDIAKTYLFTTRLDIAVWRNKTIVL